MTMPHTEWLTLCPLQFECGCSSCAALPELDRVMKPYIFEAHCGLGASKKPKVTITLIPAEGTPGAPKVSGNDPWGDSLTMMVHLALSGGRVTRDHPLGLNPAFYKP